ncbi:MAG TPA: recombination protein O N-terminal domain-containing protein [Candidatus Dojkabacteria bacterium]|nr:recombination protein O N-terminal domain-containing protein [Candidatus Dojkabacteria bacterium]HQF36708.1 recombination protein O N-terminal domain-containing protein [Candidatus Dojkabacteria bacterium]
MIVNDSGIVIRHIKVRDNSKLIWIFSPKLGRYALGVNGAYSRKISPAIGLLNCVEISIQDKSGFRTLHSILGYEEPNILMNLENQFTVLYVTNILCKLLPEQYVAVEIYKYLLKLIKVLSVRNISKGEAQKLRESFLKKICEELSLDINKIERHKLHEFVEGEFGKNLWKP